MSRAWLVLILLVGLAWADEFKPVAQWTGGMATFYVGIDMRSDGGRRGQVRFATSNGVTELWFTAAQWKDVQKAVKDALKAARELPEGENGEEVEVAKLRIRPVRQRPDPGVQLAAGPPQVGATIVVQDLAGLKGAVDEVAAALRQER